MAIVSIRGLSKKFTDAAAVDDLHLEIADGEFVSLLGPSGCGKTTTLRLIAGFLQPDAGEICVGGGVISSALHMVPPERVVEPQILLMDEPLSNLDANLREEMRFEIRRLHEEFGITTIYVTHDQAEAMATSDRIVVLNGGRMVQSGRPAEIFDHPKTRFVAEFVGKANILAGRFDGASRMQIDERLGIRVTRNPDQALRSGQASLCLRPHHIVLTANESEAEALSRQDYNLFSGVIQRRIYFGESADYTVDLAPHPFTLRVLGTPSRLYDKGQRIFALAQPEHCIVVSND